MQVNKRSLKSQNIVFRILCNFMLNCTKSRRTQCGICKIDYVFEIDLILCALLSQPHSAALSAECAKSILYCPSLSNVGIT